METNFKLSRFKTALALVLMLVFASCVNNLTEIRPWKTKSEEIQTEKKQNPGNPTNPSEKNPSPSTKIVAPPNPAILAKIEPKTDIAHPRVIDKDLQRKTLAEDGPVNKEKQQEKTSGAKESTEGSEKKKASVTPTEQLKKPKPPAKKAPPKKSDQEVLDSALEFCQASYDFWEQGDLENALDALDQAYSLILKVNPESKPEILQQRDDLRITISKRIIQCYSSRYTVANGYHKEIPLIKNRYVEKALDLFKGRDRKFFLNSYRRSGRYRPAIVKALKEEGMPEELSWLPLIESGFKVRALSRARALGIWQFIASTGYKFGLKRDQWVDERMDPERATKAAIAYLKELHQIFGDWTTVLASYNCGEGTVLKTIRKQKIDYLDHFWDLYAFLPRETAFYVPKFLAVLHILNDPETHGFSLPPVDEEIETDQVPIDKQVHLKTVGKTVGVSYGLLKELNPALRRNYTPNRTFTLNVPKGKSELLLAKLDEIPIWNPPVPAYVTHRVRNGESLSLIALRYKTTVRAIISLNNLRSRHFIRAGWKLKIPTGRRYVAVPKPSPRITGQKTDGKPIKYIVRKGDSLWRIANRFGTTAKAIRDENKLTKSRLQIGQALMIPQGSTLYEEMRTKPYKVEKGDSPYMIAQKHNMNLSQFLRLNHLTPRSMIFPGQILLVQAD